jgi:hypothetical protein
MPAPSFDSEGEGVREIIMKGAPVDLTAPEFHIGTVRRLRFGDVAAMVHMAGEAPDIIDLLCLPVLCRVCLGMAWRHEFRGAARVRLFEPQPAPAA